MKFTVEETCRLIQLYNEHECLWNLGTVQYKDRKMRQAAEADIVQRFGKTGFNIVEFKQKIKNLRCTYNQECVKIHKSKKSGSKNVYIPNLKWFHLMDKIIKASKGLTNTEDPLESITFSKQPQNIPEDETETNTKRSTVNKKIKVEKYHRIVPEAQIKRRSTDNVELTPTIKTRKIHCPQQVSPINRDQTAVNEHEAFGTYVAASLKNLSPSKALLAQHDIQAVLMQYRMGDISYPDHSHNITYSPGDMEQCQSQWDAPTDSSRATASDLLAFEREAAVFVEVNHDNGDECAVVKCEFT